MSIASRSISCNVRADTPHNFAYSAMVRRKVERIFLIHSPRIAKIEVKKAGQVRRAKLYYIRERLGKAVRIRGDVKRQTALDSANVKAVQEAAAVKAAAAKEQAGTTGESKRAAKRKAKAEAAAKK